MTAELGSCVDAWMMMIIIITTVLLCIILRIVVLLVVCTRCLVLTIIVIILRTFKIAFMNIVMIIMIIVLITIGAIGLQEKIDDLPAVTRCASDSSPQSPCRRPALLIPSERARAPEYC